MRPPRRAARATRSYANDGEGEDKAMLDAEMGSASEEEEEEEEGEEEEGEAQWKPHAEEEEEEEEESEPDDDDGEDEEDEDGEEMIDSIDEEEEAAGFNRERATKVAGSLRVLSKRSKAKRASDEFVERQREILDRGEPLQRDSIQKILNSPNIDHATKRELLGESVYPFKKCKHEGCERNAHSIANGSKDECRFHANERKKQDSYIKEREAKKRSDAEKPKCWRCGINPGSKKNNKKGIVSKVGPKGIGSEPVSRGDEMFCHACITECQKTHPVNNMHRYLKNMQCCDCNDLLAVDGRKIQKYYRVTDDTFRCRKCYKRVYDNKRKRFGSASSRKMTAGIQFQQRVSASIASALRKITKELGIK